MLEPSLALIIAVPFALAVIFPEELTVATEELDVDHVTVVSELSESTAPNCAVVPFFMEKLR